MPETPDAPLTAPARGHRTTAIGTGALAVLLGALDTYVVVGLLHQIIDDLQIPANDLERLTPIITGYLLGYVAAMPLLGQASDRFGRKLLLQLCLAGFVVGSAVTALGGDVVTLTAGRLLQGIAGGALLPVTMALAADLFTAAQRARVLGALGAAQELGSVIGPVYGIALAAAMGWRSVFWVNIPLAALAMIGVHFALPGGRRETGKRTRVDLVGSGLLTLTLGLLVVGLYNPNPREQLLPDWGVPVLIAAAVALVAFMGWETRARTRLIDTSGARLVPFFAALGTSFAAGAALMVTLVDVDLFAQTLLGQQDTGAVTLLLRFLIALPIGALLGGFAANRLGERWVACVGMVVAAGGFWLMSGWTDNVTDAVHTLGPISLPRLGTDLAVVGLGLGLVIAPLSVAVLRTVPGTQHGIASSGVVVARMTGMLVGVAALTAWGLHRFHQLTADLDIPVRVLYDSQQDYDDALAHYVGAVKDAALTQYTGIFWATVFVCLAGALSALFVGGSRRQLPTLRDNDSG